MRLAPFIKQTLVSSYSKDEVLTRLRNKTQLINSDTITESAVFNGSFSKGEFRLSLRVSYSQNALPLAAGKVEDTSRGSIIFLRFKLFPAARLYLIMFTVIAVFIGVVFLRMSGSSIGGTIALLVALVNYFVLNANFHRKAEESIQEFRKILSGG